MSLLSDFAALFFPRQCCACGSTLVKGEEVICTRCMLELPYATPAAAHYPVLEKLAARLPLAHTFALLQFRKGGPVQRLLYQMKYSMRPDIGLRLGEVCGDRLHKEGFAKDIDMVLPVPLHRARERKRGYNQSMQFAEGISRKLDVAFDGSVLRRHKNTPTQTRKSSAERWKNVAHAFVAHNPERIAGKRALLVDDVVTTGATLEACGRCLMQSGCAQLSVACIAEAR